MVVANDIEIRQHNRMGIEKYPLTMIEGSLIEVIFRAYRSGIHTVIHTAAQPSHDWAARQPFVDFSVNGTGTLILLGTTHNRASTPRKPASLCRTSMAARNESKNSTVVCSS